MSDLKLHMQGLTLTARQWTELEIALQDAKSYNAMLINNSKNFGFNDWRDELGRMVKALEKLNEKRGTAGAAYKTLSANLKTIPDHGFKQIGLYLPGAICDEQMRFKAIINQISTGDHSMLKDALEAATNAFSNTRTPGSGGARKQAVKYNFGIQKLAKLFLEIVPGYKISADPDSYFSRLVSYWLEFTMNQPGYPKRHIQNAINDLKNWREITF